MFDSDNWLSSSHLDFSTLCYKKCDYIFSDIFKKIKQNHKYFIGRCDFDLKSLSVKAVWCTKDAKWISWQRLESWKSAKENPQNGYNCAATRQRETAHSSHSSRGPRAQSGGQAKKAPISSWDFAWNCNSPFKCAQDNSPWSPAQMIHTTSCSAVVWSQSHHPSQSLINNLIVCNTSCNRYVE